ncbi:hypothetical protein AB0M68_03840 [Streptomyces sp. NPDC051453]|uniref:hypothetical protein n=1 Tax=Streptomyces sp. NPDC051453 TaxID=3154941 RepID=UPI0034374084
MNPNWTVAAVLTVIAGAIFYVLRLRSVLRESLDRGRIVAFAPLHTDPPRIETEPGTDTDRLLDALNAYYEPAGLERLGDAINQTRKETP